MGPIDLKLFVECFLFIRSFTSQNIDYKIFLHISMYKRIASYT